MFLRTQRADGVVERADRLASDQAQTRETTQTRSRQPVGESGWESCEITYDELHDIYKPCFFPAKRRFHFCANAKGPTGYFCVAETAPFETHLRYPDIDRNTQALVNDLVERLTVGGWEQDSMGRYWFSYRFRRRCR